MKKSNFNNERLEKLAYVIEFLILMKSFIFKFQIATPTFFEL